MVLHSNQYDLHCISNMTLETRTAWVGCADIIQTDTALSPTHSTLSTVKTFTLLSEATNKAPNLLNYLKALFSA